MLPARNARHGLLYTRDGLLRIRNAAFRDDDRPLDPDCGCPACRRVSRALVHHLIRSGEITGQVLATLHNIRFFLDFMGDLRQAVASGSLRARHGLQRLRYTVLGTLTRPDPAKVRSMIAMPSLLVLLQASPGAQLVSFVPLILIFVIFYFLVIAPARKRQKKLQKTIDALKRGDRVITTGGIYGEVVSTEGGVIFLKVADNVRLKMAKSAIAGLEQEEPEVKT